MKKQHILEKMLIAICLAAVFFPASAQKLIPVTREGVEVGKKMKLFDGMLYYTTIEESGSKLWACDVITRKSKVIMKSKEKIGNFFDMGKTLLFSTDNGHDDEDGRLFYLDEHHRPNEIFMKDEASADVRPVHGRHLEIYPFRQGFLILAPLRDFKSKFKLYRYNLKQDSARRFFPENFFVFPGLCVSPDQKLIIAGVEITPPHPWENQKSFWNQFSQLFLIHAGGDGPMFEKWMDHAELNDAVFKYTGRTWINLDYKELKDKGNDIQRHTVFVITAPSENKGTLPKHVGEAIDTSLFLFQKKASYYFSHKGNIYLVSAFEYPTSYQLKYGKLSGHEMTDFAGVVGQYGYDDVLYIFTRHKSEKEYYKGWTLKYGFDSAQYLMAHTFFSVNYDPVLTTTLPTASSLRIFNDSLGNPLYLCDAATGENKIIVLGKNGPATLVSAGQKLTNVDYINNYWHGNIIMKQKGPAGSPEQLMLNCKTGTQPICSPGDKYQPGFDFVCNGHLFFGVFTAQTTKLINWHSDGTLEGTHRLDLGDLRLQLDFSRPYISGTSIFLLGHNAEDVKSKDQLFVLDVN
jgi:hypothetical protein